MTLRTVVLDHRIAAVAVGAVVAGIVAGLASAVAGPGIGVAVGLAVAGPLLYAHATDLDREATATRPTNGVVLDVAVAIGAGVLLGVGATILLDRLVTDASWLLVGVGAGGATGGGSFAFRLRTASA